MNDNIADDLLRYLDQIQPMLLTASKQTDVIEKTLETIDFSLLDDVINNFEIEYFGDPSLQKNYETEKLLYCAGFWYIPSLPYPVFKNLLNLDDKSKENVSSLIVELMNKDDCSHLTNIVDGWDLDLFKEKRIIFQEALQAHKDGKYVLSIPALALQIEPIIKDFLQVSHKKFIGTVKDELKKRVEDLKEEKKNEIFCDETKSREMYRYLVSLKFISDAVFPFYGRQDFDNVENTFNRHVIGHGALNVVEYDQVLSTKLILFLDTLYYVLHFFQDKNEKSLKD